MTRDIERIPCQIGCIDTASIPATLISTTGHHCEVWQTTRIHIKKGVRRSSNYVIKRHLEPCTLREIEILRRDYRLLRKRLGEIVPKTVFLATRIVGGINCLAVAQAVTPWFNIANPGNEEEAIELLRQNPRALAQLCSFIQAAGVWARQGRIIDLWGLDNLVLDTEHRIRYVDSFRVFFYEDMQFLSDQPDDELLNMIGLSHTRLNYLSFVVEAAKHQRAAARP